MNKCEHNEKINLFCISQHCQHKQSGGCQTCIKKYHNHITNVKILTEADLNEVFKIFTNIDHSFKMNCRSIQQAIYSYFNSLKQEINNSLEIICKTLITQLGSPYMYEKNVFSIFKRIKGNQYKRIYVKDLKRLFQLSRIAPNSKQLSREQGKLYKQYLKRAQKNISSLQNFMSKEFQAIIRQWIQNFKHDKSTYQPLGNLIKETLSEGGRSSVLEVNIQKQLEKAKQKNGISSLNNEKLDDKNKISTQRATSIVKSQDIEKQKEKNAKYQPDKNKKNQTLLDTNHLKSSQFQRSITPAKQKSNFNEFNNPSGLSLISTFPSKQNVNHKFGVKDFSTIQKAQASEKQKQNLSKHKRQVSLDKKYNLTTNQSNYNSVGSNKYQYTQNKHKDLSSLLQNYKIQSYQNRQNRQKNTAQRKNQIFMNSLTEQSAKRKKQEQRSERSNSGSSHKNNSKQNEINMRKQQLIEIMKNNSAVIKIQNQSKLHEGQQKGKGQNGFKNEFKFLEGDSNSSPIKKIRQNAKEEKNSPYRQRIVEKSNIQKEVKQQSDSPSYLNTKKKDQNIVLKNQSSILLSNKINGNNSQSRLSARKNLSVIVQERKGIQQHLNQINFLNNQSKITEQTISYKQNKESRNSATESKNTLSSYSNTPTPNSHKKSIQRIISEENQSLNSIKQINSDKNHKKNQSFLNGQPLLDSIAKQSMGAHFRLPIQQKQEKEKEIGCSRLIIVPAPEKFNYQTAYNDCDSPLLKKKQSIKQKSPKITQNKSAKTKKEYDGESPSKFQDQKQKSPNSSKQLLKQNEQKSLNLLLKSIHSKTNQAINLLQEALKYAPNNLSAAQYLSFIYLQNNRPRQALNICNSILERFIVSSQNNQSQQLLMSLQTNKAAALNMLGRWSETIILLQKYLKVRQTFNSSSTFSSSNPNSNCLHLMFKNLADAYYFNSNYQKAIFYYQKSIKINNHYDEAYYNMAVCLYIQNNFHNAKMVIDKALNITENSEYLELNKQIKNRLNKLEQYNE